MTLEEFNKLLDKCAKENYVINPNFHISQEEFIEVIIEALLGKDWCIVNPVKYEQGLALECEEILAIYTSKPNKFLLKLGSLIRRIKFKLK